MTREITLTDRDGDELRVTVNLDYGAPWPVEVASAGPGGFVVVESPEAWEHRNGYNPGWVSAACQDYDADESCCAAYDDGDNLIGGWEIAAPGQSARTDAASQDELRGAAIDDAL